MPAADRPQPVQDSYQYPSAAGVNLPTAETAAYYAVAPALAEQPLTREPESAAKRFPTLNWKRSTLVARVSQAGPLYIHDKIYPEEFVKTFLKAPQSRQGALGFAAVNGFTEADGQPAANVELHPYRYQNGHWSNRLIRATAQRAMASLLEKEELRGKVNLVYLDPPYNISFRSNFQTAIDLPETAENLSGIPQDALSIKAFRDTYRDGIHSYLDGLHEQLTLARELLAADGSIILQIGPDNVHQVAMLLGEVFGPENHVATIPYRTTRMAAKRIQEVGNWLVWFAKELDSCKYRQLYLPRDTAAVIADRGGRVRYQNKDGSIRDLTNQELLNPRKIAKEMRSLFTTRALDSAHSSATGRSDTFYLHPDGIPCPEHPSAWDNHVCNSGCNQGDSQSECPFGRSCDGKPDNETTCHSNAYPCPTGRHWSVSLKGLHSIAQQGRMLIVDSTPNFKVYESEQAGNPLTAIWDDAGSVRDKQYIVETPAKVLERCLLMTTDPGDLVLDLTCGSGAMPVQCETWGRRWLAVDVSAISLAIARERIATTLYPCHILADSPEGHKLDHELEQDLYPPEQRIPFAAVQKPATAYRHDPAAGFVNERQLRVSAAVLAFGPDLNRDIIRHPDRTRKDPRRKRTATPFIVASDSPHRAITPEQAREDAPESLINPAELIQENGFAVHLKESLELAGIKQFHGVDGVARFRVENLQPAPHRALTHTGELIAPDQSRHKACFYIGQESDAIYARTTHAALRAARLEPDIEYLVMVGFEIHGDAHAAAAAYTHPIVLPVQANRDLQIPHLKNRSTDDAFTIISEPEVVAHQEPDGQISLEVTGLNAFNPTTGRAEYSQSNAIVGLMVDTEYDGQSFRARLINVKESRRNQRTLRLLKAAFQPHLDADKWQRMTSHRTLPFTPSPEFPIAVKVIDRAGLEHMTVLEP